MKYNDQTIKEALQNLINVYQLKGKLHETAIKQVWHEQMGSKISNHTTKIEVEKGSVTIYVNSAPLRNELLFGKEKIIKMFNDFLKEEYVKEVFLK